METRRLNRLEEIRKVKEAEEEALAAVMGITLPPRQNNISESELKMAIEGDDKADGKRFGQATENIEGIGFNKEYAYKILCEF